MMMRVVGTEVKPVDIVDPAVERNDSLRIEIVTRTDGESIPIFPFFVVR